MASLAQTVNVEALSEKVRESIVNIKVDFLLSDNSDSKCKDSNQGTGFIVSEDGHVLTAYHLFKPPKRCDEFSGYIISGNIGGYDGEFPRKMRIASRPNDFSDTALLKLADRLTPYDAAPVCRMSDPNAGTEFYAFGFPYDSGFAPLDVRYLNPDGGGKDRWVVSSDITHGMSGGPVYNTDGYVVAFVQGGLKNTPAVRYIVPLRQARVEIEIGGNLEDCDCVGCIRREFLELEEIIEEIDLSISIRESMILRSISDYINNPLPAKWGRLRYWAEKEINRLDSAIQKILEFRSKYSINSGQYRLKKLLQFTDSPTPFNRSDPEYVQKRVEILGVVSETWDSKGVIYREILSISLPTREEAIRYKAEVEAGLKSLVLNLDYIIDSMHQELGITLNQSQ